MDRDERLLCFGLTFGEKNLGRLCDDLTDTMKVFNAADEDWNNATEEQIENEVAYQYFNGWCDKFLNEEFVMKVLGR